MKHILSSVARALAKRFSPRAKTGIVLGVALAVVAAGCGRGGGGGGGAAQDHRAFKPIDAANAVFWDRQTTETAELLRAIATEFNDSHAAALPIRVEHSGGYSEIFRKVSASIQAGELPAMAVAYQSMTAEYAQAGAVVALDGFVNDPKIGLTKEDLADFFPIVIETNKYPDFADKMFSFPFCKSALMLFFNKKLLADAGLNAPPATWDEFLAQCRQVKQKTGKAGYAVSVDCSTIAGMMFSMGGEVVDGKKTLYDSPQALKTFDLIETLVKEGLAYQITPGSYDDEAALAQGNVAFCMRSSSSRTNFLQIMQGNLDRWGMVAIPQDDPKNPHTVLYGPNIVIFNTTQDQQQSAWQFVKYFKSPAVSVRWALGTGYLPIRQSAAQDPAMQKFWSEWPYNRAAFDCLPYAKSEPNLAGWQEVRALVEKAETEILTGVKPAKQAALELKQKADAVLVRQ